MGALLTASRWLLVPVSAAFGCWFGIVLAMLLYAGFDHFCPASARVSGICHASWFHYTTEFAQYCGAAAGAAMAVSLPFLFAPSHKRTMSTLAYLAGAAFALYEAAGTAATIWPYVACALIAGLATLAWTWHTRVFAK